MAILPNAPTFQTTPTHDGSGQTVHPSVVDFKIEYGRDSWNGYRYWMAITPYPASNDAHEDPNILASNDGSSWEVPIWITNPLDDKLGSAFTEPDNYNNDTELVFDPDKNCLIVYWREYLRDVHDLIWRIELNPNKTISSKIQVVSNNYSDGFGTDLSPTVWRKSATEWYMWSANGENVYIRTSPDGITWSGRTPTNNPWRTWKKEPYKAWHLEAKPNYRENRVEFLMCGYPDNGQVYTFMNLFYAECPMDDLTHLSMPFDNFVVSIGSGSWDDKFIYRTSFVIETTDNGYFYHVWYSARSQGNIWHLGKTSGRMATTFTPSKLGDVDLYANGQTNNLPIYQIDPKVDTSLRTYINGKAGYYKLVDEGDPNASDVRVFANGAIKSLSK